MIVVVGASHHTAPIEVRERLVVPRDATVAFLQSLVAAPSLSEALVISTCNRLEIVASGSGLAEASALHDVAAAESVAAALKRAIVARAGPVEQHLYTHVGAAAVTHLFRVACSLDSLVLGEPQILGQVKAAHQLARAAGTAGATLGRVVTGAVRTAKRVRTETAIGVGQVSIPSVAVDLAQQIFGDLKGVTGLLVGSGEMAESVARLVTAAGARLIVLGRNLERVSELAQAVGGEARGWSELAASLCAADLVISSTSAPGVVLTHEMIAQSRRARRGRNQFLIDLALPRDIDPRVDKMDGIFLYNVDDFAQLVGESLSTRSKDAELAANIVREETEAFGRRRHAEQATPTILRLRNHLGSLLKAELARSLGGKLKHLGDEEHRALERMLEAALNKMLHAPSARLRQAASLGLADNAELEQLTQVLHELFPLAPTELESSTAPENDAALDADAAPEGDAALEANAAKLAKSHSGQGST